MRNDSWVRFKRASGAEGACLGSGQGRTRPGVGVRVCPGKERALGRRQGLCKGPGAGRSRAQQDPGGGDAQEGPEMESGQLQRHWGAGGPGAGLDSQGISGQRAGRGPVGHCGRQEGCRAGLHGKERPLHLSARPLTAPALFIRPSLVLHLRRLAGALPVCLQGKGWPRAPSSQWSPLAPGVGDAALERSVCRKFGLAALGTRAGWRGPGLGHHCAWLRGGWGGSPGGDEHETSPWGCPG